MPGRPSRSRISIAIAALGGQGGGVLADWVVHTAEAAGWIAQSTSVPGVAQRTGTTVYYVELAPPERPKVVLALMPVPGDVDVAIGAELMEAGRAILRGLVTPERTTLVASTHRVFGITEKSHLGDGAADGGAVLAAAKAAARRLVAFDMQALADRCGCPVSSVLLGALAGSGALPFAREHYERAIRDYGVAVAANLAGFAAGLQAATAGVDATAPATALQAPTTMAGRRLDAQIGAGFPAHLHGLLAAAGARLLDYLDEGYAELFLERLAPVRRLDLEQGTDRAPALLTSTVARYLALWMCYEDVYRVADLKTRAGRFDRFRAEVRADSRQIVDVYEFMHPRWTEVCESLPARLGAWLLHSPRAQGIGARFLGRGRRVRTTSAITFAWLWSLARLGTWRRGTLRYAIEQARIERWLESVTAVAREDYALAVELAECARLIKGYGDTHARGLANFERIFANLGTLRRAPDPALAVRQCRSAALADEDGKAFEKVLAGFMAPAVA